MQEISIVVCVIIIMVIFILHNKNKSKSTSNDNDYNTEQPKYFDQYYYKIPVINQVAKPSQHPDESLNHLTNLNYQLNKYSNMDSDIMNSRWCSKSEGFDKNNSGSNDYSNMDIQAVPRKMSSLLKGLPVGILNNKYSSNVEAFRDDEYSRVTNNNDFSYNDKFSESAFSPEKIQEITDKVESRYKANISDTDKVNLRKFLRELDDDTKMVDIPDRK